jgi:hypothetical protein
VITYNLLDRAGCAFPQSCSQQVKHTCPLDCCSRATKHLEKDPHGTCSMNDMHNLHCSCETSWAFLLLGCVQEAILRVLRLPLLPDMGYLRFSADLSKCHSKQQQQETGVRCMIQLYSVAVTA